MTNFYELSKQYALNKLATYYKEEEKYPADVAMKKAEKKINTLIRPAEIYDISNSKTTLDNIYKRLLISCQNRNMMSSVIKFDKREEKFADILEQFNPSKILKKYKSGEDLYKIFEQTKEFGVNKEHNELWKSFAQSVIDGAKFISRFDNVEAFKKMIGNIASYFPGTMMIPRLICGEIRGMGEALACDFIKEIGYVEYAKPDVHINYIIKEICNIDAIYDNESIKVKDKEKITAIEVLNAIQQIAKNAGVSAFAVDKILWLIASGKYYDVDGKEPTIKIKNPANQDLRDEFLEKIKEA